MKVVALAVVTVSVVAGLVLVGPPSEARARKLDARRVEDLQRLSAAVDLYRSRRGSLPASLNEASRETGDSQTVGDPLTGRPYLYQVVGADTYELCADFQRSSGNSDADRLYGEPVFWAHAAASQCFRLKAQNLPH
jgi:hypothetical protein